MKLDSKYFDSIRVKPKGKAAEKVVSSTCQWRGCENPATNKAPRGRGHEGEYLSFCMNHVRAYNKSYNYFNGMTDEEFIDYQKSAATGHRPTWTVSSNGTANVGGDGKSGNNTRNPAQGFDPAFARFDPHGLFGEQVTSGKVRKRPVRSMERKALTAMHLPDDSSKAEIKARFKELVKRHHPDSNGGDRGAEDKLREVIQAYNYLKKAGLC